MCKGKNQESECKRLYWDLIELLSWAKTRQDEEKKELASLCDMITRKKKDKNTSYPLT